jgi:thioredoxin
MKTTRKNLLRTGCIASLTTCLLTSCDKTRKLANSFGVNSSARPAVAYNGSLVTELDRSTYDQFPDQPGRVVLVDFHADWCGPCRKLSPILEKIVQEHEGLVLVGKVNVDLNKELAAKEGVSEIPDVRVYRDGKQIAKFVGAPSENKLRQQINEYVKGLPPITASTTNGASPSQPGSVITPMSKDWLPPGMSRR